MRAAVFGAMLAACAAATASAHPAIHPFDPHGSRETIPTGITHSRTVAGYFTDGNGKTHGFMYRTR